MRKLLLLLVAVNLGFAAGAARAVFETAGSATPPYNKAGC